MRDARIPSGVWVKDAEIYVAGDTEVEADRSTWKTMAVLRVQPPNVPFRIGWRTRQFAEAEFYSEPIQTENAMFAMEVGDKGVWFVARPVDGRAALTIELVELTTRDDPQYRKTPRY